MDADSEFAEADSLELAWNARLGRSRRSLDDLDMAFQQIARRGEL